MTTKLCNKWIPFPRRVFTFGRGPFSFADCSARTSKSEVEIENRRNKSQVKQLAYFTGADEAGNGKEDHRGPRLSVEPEHELIDSNVSLRVPSPSDLGTTEVALLPSR